MATKPPSTLAELDSMEFEYSQTGHPMYVDDAGNTVCLHIHRPLFEEIESVAKNDDHVLELCRRRGHYEWLSQKREHYSDQS